MPNFALYDMSSNTVTTDDWFELTKDKPISSYVDAEKFTPVIKDKGRFIRSDAGKKLTKLNNRTRIPFGENIRDAIKSLK